MAFGINNPTRCAITLNKKRDSLGVKSQISWSIRFVYGNSCVLDITEASPKFYGSFNKTMSVLDKHSIEMTAVYLAKSYCSPSLTYVCEVWNTSIGQCPPQS